VNLRNLRIKFFGKIFANFVQQIPEKDDETNHEWTRINANQKPGNHGCRGLHRFDIRIPSIRLIRGRLLSVYQSRDCGIRVHLSDRSLGEGGFVVFRSLKKVKKYLLTLSANPAISRTSTQTNPQKQPQQQTKTKPQNTSA
jgi:hypothetical protein